MADPQLAVETRLKDFMSKELDKLENNMKAFSAGATQSMGKAEKGTNKFLDTFKGMISAQAVIGAVKGAWGALTKTVEQSIAAADQQAKAEARLQNALGYTSTLLLEQAAALQKVTLFGDEVTLAAQSRIADFIKEEEVIARLTPAIQDFAAAKGIDLVSAADLVTKSVSSNMNALGRYGIQIEGAAGSAERAESAIRSLDAAFGGSARTVAQAGTGPITQLQNAYSDLQEEIGMAFIPVLADASNYLKPLVEDATKFFIDNGPAITASIKDWAREIKFMVESPVAEWLGEMASGMAHLFGMTVAGRIEKLNGELSKVGAEIDKIATTTASASSRGSSGGGKTMTDRMLDDILGEEGASVNDPRLGQLKAESARIEKELKEMQDRHAEMLGMGKAKGPQDMSGKKSAIAVASPAAAGSAAAAVVDDGSAAAVSRLQANLAAMTALEFGHIEERKEIAGGFAQYELELYDMLAQAAMTEEERETAALINARDKKLEDLEWQRVLGVLTEQQLSDGKLAIQEDYTEKSMAMEQAKNLAIATSYGQLMGSMGGFLDLFAKKNRSAAIAAKTLAIGEAAINTLVGITTVFRTSKTPPPGNFIEAAAVGFSGAAAVGKIAATPLAMGAINFGGGPVLVGERGPELLHLPGGAQVTPADQTRRLTAGGGVTLNLNIAPGASVDRVAAATITDKMRDLGDLLRMGQSSGVIRLKEIMARG